MAMRSWSPTPGVLGNCLRFRHSRTLARTQVSKSHVFLLGDNRHSSRDGRLVGDVPADGVHGSCVVFGRGSISGAFTKPLQENPEGDVEWRKVTRWSRIGKRLDSL